MKNNKICIIGGLGFIGSNLTKILDNSNQITILDIGEKPKYLLNHIKYTDAVFDSLNIFKKQNYDYIFYLAGNASVGESVSNPVLDLEKNTVHLLNLLEIIKNRKSKLIFISSAACYGEMKNHETAYSNEPISPYGMSKLFSEKYLKYYNKHYGLQVLICRLYSPFGEYNQKQVIYDTILRLLKHPKKITIYNPNSQRDFIYIAEAIRAILFLCDQNQFTADNFDVGRGENMSILEVSKKIMDILNIHPVIKTETKKFTGDPIKQIANTNKLKTLGYNFSTSISSDLLKTINWIKEINK